MALSPAKLLAFFQETRHRSLQLIADLSAEDCVVQAATFTSPVKWHLAHTSWFFEEFVLQFSGPESDKVFHPKFGQIFNSYYISVNTPFAKSNRGLLTKPSLSEVLDYRKFVDEHIASLLSKPGVENDTLAIIETGIHHEQQHQELLLMDIKYLFYGNPLKPEVPVRNALVTDTTEQTAFEWLHLQADTYQIGATGDEFAFDNEFPQHLQHCHNIHIANQLVTNGEYLQFMQEGGYDNPQLWLDEGWQWKMQHKVQSPLYWEKHGHDWYQFNFSGLEPLERQKTLCHVSYYEAQAFASWAKAQLPTEFAWEAMEGALNWGKRWEWTSSAYAPYPGYQAPSGAMGEYNGKFMVNQMVLRGASFATPQSHRRKSYRNFYHPHHRWAFTGIRLAKNIEA